MSAANGPKRQRTVREPIEPSDLSSVYGLRECGRDQHTTERAPGGWDANPIYDQPTTDGQADQAHGVHGSGTDPNVSAVSGREQQVDVQPFIDTSVSPP